jgi:serine/threonine protein kinase
MQIRFKENCDYPPLPGNMYSKELRDLISICIQPDPRKRPELSQLRERCEQMCRLLWLRIISIIVFVICQSENNGEISSSRSMPRMLPIDLESLPSSSFPKDYHFHPNHSMKKIILIFVSSDYNFINKPAPLKL